MTSTYVKPLDTSKVFRIKSLSANSYLGVAADGIIQLVAPGIASTANDKWVVTATNSEFSVPQAAPAMGYFLKNVGTNKYFSWTFSNKGQSWAANGVALTTVPNTAVVSLIPYIAQPSTYSILFKGRNTTHATLVYTDTKDVYGFAYAYSKASQYAAVGAPIRWVFEAVGNVSDLPPTPNPEESKFVSPIIKKDPLPSGLYRIRSFTGSYLLTMPVQPTNSEGKTIPYVSRQAPVKEYQGWQVTRKENGLYTISNSGNERYLAAPSSNLTKGALLLGQSMTDNPKPYEWNIQTVNGVLFFIGVPTATLSMGFADYDAHEAKQVALTTSDNAASQIWLFETMESLGSASFSHSRFLTPGTYIIESSQNNSWLVVNDAEELSFDSQRTRGTHFLITYKDNHTAKFTISYKDSDGGRSYVVASPVNGGRLETTDSQVDGTEWAVLRLEPGEDVFHIVRVDVQDPQRSISSRQISSRGKSYFAIDPLAPGEVMQMFRFHHIE
ncbi:hypothetical protein D9613_008563 [Agrocybe pediades]|uniref:Ricin B lectin domain-containing protein n=1 Tax=Agrocybe pediades TaxID=84607 RepID=A0A8H4QT76_9AGAR|nr:hypothetical protein D9613_008563 [Agrocybe pediades]